jgi:sugar O-acyltransferase (sialic acid O-acetyltransferase NeuD family)
MSRKAAIYGAGGHSRVVASILRVNRVPLLGFFDDSYSGQKEMIQGAPLLGSFRAILDFQEQIEGVYLALGNNRQRGEAFFFLQEHAFVLPYLIHPRSLAEDDVSLGPGSVVCLGSLLCTEARIGQGCIINTGSTVEHETVIGDFVHLAPRVTVAGRAKIGDYTFIGMNASIGNGRSIGRDVVIGAGSVVLRDVPDNARVVGVYH